MRTLKTELQKIGIIFLAGFFIYPQLEQLFGSFMAHVAAPIFGFSFPAGKSFDANLSMGILGGLLVVMLGYINEIKPLRKLPFWIHCIIGAIIITGMEWITGQIVNISMGLQVWDYKWLPLSTPDGQINLFFSFLWLLLSPVCFWLDDQLRDITKILFENGKIKCFIKPIQSIKYSFENTKKPWMRRYT